MYKITQTLIDTPQGRITIKDEIIVHDIEKKRNELLTEHNALSVRFTYEEYDNKT